MSVAFWQCRDEEEAVSPWQPPGVGGDGGRVVGRWCANVVWKCLRGSGSWVGPHTDSGIEARSWRMSQFPGHGWRKGASQETGVVYVGQWHLEEHGRWGEARLSVWARVSRGVLPREEQEVRDCSWNRFVCLAAEFGLRPLVTVAGNHYLGCCLKIQFLGLRPSTETLCLGTSLPPADFYLLARVWLLLPKTVKY